MDFGDTQMMQQEEKDTAINNFLEATHLNYSCTLLNTRDGCRQDYVMPEVHTTNSMPNYSIISNNQSN
jgi:hypothetical protein